MRACLTVTLDLDSGLYALPVVTDHDERGAYLELGIARALPSGARRSADEIAAAEGCALETIERLVREQLAARVRS